MTTTTAATSNTATFTKLRDGSWGLRIVGPHAVEPGQSVTVTKKSGETSTERVGEVIWSDGKGVTLAKISARVATPAAPHAAAPARSYNASSARWVTCGYCGGRYPRGGLCSRCGDEG